MEGRARGWVMHRTGFWGVLPTWVWEWQPPCVTQVLHEVIYIFNLVNNEELNIQTFEFAKHLNQFK